MEEAAEVFSRLGTLEQRLAGFEVRLRRCEDLEEVVRGDGNGKLGLVTKVDRLTQTEAWRGSQVNLLWSAFATALVGALVGVILRGCEVPHDHGVTSPSAATTTTEARKP